MHEIIGVIGSVCFAICAIPQAIQSFQDGHSRGLNWFFLIAWAGGEFFTVAYVWPSGDWILLFNYLFNSLCLSVMLYFKIWERK